MVTKLWTAWLWEVIARKCKATQLSSQLKVRAQSCASAPKHPVKPEMQELKLATRPGLRHVMLGLSAALLETVPPKPLGLTCAFHLLICQYIIQPQGGSLLLLQSQRLTHPCQARPRVVRSPQPGARTHTGLVPYQVARL